MMIGRRLILTLVVGDTSVSEARTLQHGSEGVPGRVMAPRACSNQGAMRAHQTLWIDTEQHLNPYNLAVRIIQSSASLVHIAAEVRLTRSELILQAWGPALKLGPEPDTSES